VCAPAQAKQSAGDAPGAAQLHLIVVSLHKMCGLIVAGQVQASGLRLIPSSKSIKAVQLLEQQVAASMAEQQHKQEQERKQALKAALGADDLPPLKGGQKEEDLPEVD